MNTSDTGEPKYEDREVLHSMCADRCGPDCTTSEQEVLPPAARRKWVAEVRHRLEVDRATGRADRAEREARGGGFPWSMLIFWALLLLSIGGCIGWSVNRLLEIL